MCWQVWWRWQLLYIVQMLSQEGVEWLSFISSSLVLLYLYMFQQWGTQHMWSVCVLALHYAPGYNIENTKWKQLCPIVINATLWCPVNIGCMNTMNTMQWAFFTSVEHGVSLTFSPLCTARPGLPLLPACTACPGLPISAPVNGLNDQRHRRSPSHYPLWFSHLHIKRWRWF